MLVDKTHFVDTILRPVTVFLAEALKGDFSGRLLARTAEPLISAIESVPDAGRVAVFLQNAQTADLELVSGPSFNEVEVGTLIRLLHDGQSTHAHAKTLNIPLPDTNGPSHLLRVFPLRVPGERPAALLVTARDVESPPSGDVFDTFIDQMTQLAGLVVEGRRLRHRMTSQQSVLFALLDAAPDAIIRIDRYGIILDFLGRAPEMFGYSAHEVIGQPLARLMPEPHAKRHDDYVDAFLKTGKRRLPDFGRRLQAKRKDGSAFPVEIALSQLTGDHTVEFIGTVRDITKRVTDEAELETMRNALETAARQSALGEQAAIIAHELNQPLTAIANYLDAMDLHLAEMPREDAEPLRELARKAAGQARIGGEVIRRTRRMALRGEAELKSDDFHAAVGEAMDLISKSPLAADVAIECRHTGRTDAIVFDRVQIQQIVINLASNALRALATCEDRRLRVTSHVCDTTAEIRVEDTGPGIPDHDKDKIFAQYYRKSEGGMGLGLAIVSRIASAHGGSVSVRDRDGGGALFTLQIPRRTEM